MLLQLLRRNNVRCVGIGAIAALRAPFADAVRQAGLTAEMLRRWQPVVESVTTGCPARTATP
jgi:hypothetical protein